MDIKKELIAMTEEKMFVQLSQRYSILSEKIFLEGVYIWGTGRLGHFAHEQCEKNNIKTKGYVDNNELLWDDNSKIFSCNILTADDIVVIASVYYPEIAKQLESIGVKMFIYYEELAYLKNMNIYSMSFQNIFDELERNKQEYIRIYEMLQDDLSKEVYENILRYKMTLDTKYTIKAYELSVKQGKQDFDKLIVERLGDGCVFYDVGGFDGESTMDFIQSVDNYSKIYFFEPDAKIMFETKKRLSNQKNIHFVEAIVGAKTGSAGYDAVGGGAGMVTKTGDYVVDVVTLDDFIEEGKSYIKLDVEGYEWMVLQGAKNFISQYKPMLSVSVYHKPEDIHWLIDYVLSLNSEYKIYMRHYTKAYADTRCYFV